MCTSLLAAVATASAIAVPSHALAAEPYFKSNVSCWDYERSDGGGSVSCQSCSASDNNDGNTMANAVVHMVWAWRGDEPHDDDRVRNRSSR